MSRETNPDCVIKHMVLLKWKKGTTQEQIDLFRVWNRKMADDIGFAFEYESGPTLDPRYHSADFDFCIMMSLGGGYASMDTFMSHWSHLRDDEEAAEATKIIEQAMSFNFEVYPYGRKEYDPELAAKDIAAELKRTRPVHPDPTMAYVPDIRGHFMAGDADKILEEAGLVIDPIPEEILGNTWAPGRINRTDPIMYSEVPKGTKVKVQINGDYLMGVDVPYRFKGDDVAGSPLDIY